MSNPPTLEQSITAVKDSRPPVSDDLTYLTIIETHLTPALLPTLNEVLQDVPLCQKIGWDLIHMLIPIPGSAQCLKTIARLGNPREVILQVAEALRVLRVGEDDVIPESVEEAREIVDRKMEDTNGALHGGPSDSDKFTTLVNMLATLHPRIKTKYPSRFLSTSMMAVLAAYKPSPQETYAVVSFIQTLAPQKRPALPTRKSSLSMQNLAITEPSKGEQAPDPEASAEDPKESAITKKLLQSFLTHVLELYVNESRLEWAPRLLEHYQPSKVVQGRKTRCEAYREDPELQEREAGVGQMVALARDLELRDSTYMLEQLKAKKDIEPPSPVDTDGDGDEAEANMPNAPEDIPLSRAGTLFLLTHAIFSSTLFETTHTSLPTLTLFPDFATILASFIGVHGVENTGREDASLIDALLAIGLWLENNDKFVSGPLEDDEFLQLLQSLSLISANCPHERLRYAAHILIGNILHAHPADTVRVQFLADTLEHCPYESLRASAVGWLKEELITAHKRSSSTAQTLGHEGHTHSPQRNAFASPAALSVLQPYLFPYEFALSSEGEAELWEDFNKTYVFNMAALGFLIFITQWEGKEVTVPEGMLSVVDEIYLQPLKATSERLELALARKLGEGKLSGMGENEKQIALMDVEHVKERIQRCEEVGVGK